LLDHGIEGLRIGLPRNHFFDPEFVDADVLAAVDAAARELERLGATLVPVDFPDPSTYEDGGAFLAEAASYHEQRLQADDSAFAPSVLSRLRPALAVSAIDYSRARYRQLEFRAAMRSLYADVDLILTPTTPKTALPFPEDATLIPSSLLSRNTGVFNLGGNPVISLLCGFDGNGLPVGLQLAGRWWEEGTVLRAAHAYQQSTDWHRRRPPL
jgi:aspartyl-tRNA(Asn)/glutamyl-tRNA(Gln) amidotransferase subunit A